MKNHSIKLIIKYQKVLAAISVLCVILLCVFTKTPEIQGQISGFNLEDSKYFQDGVAIAKKFGSTKFIQINIVPEETSTKTVINSLISLERNITKNIPGTRIQSLHHGRKLIQIGGAENEHIQETLKRASKLPLVDQLISKDRKSFLMIVFLDQGQKLDLNQFNTIVNYSYLGIRKTNVFSPYHVEYEIGTSIKKDAETLSLLIISFFILLILFAFRSYTALLFSMSIIGATLVSCLFFFETFTIPLNIITVLVIPVILVLSLADTIHLLTGYRSANTEKSHDDKLHSVLQKYLVPSFMTSMTTAIAFFSFQFNNSQNIRDFGLITGIVVLLTFVLTFGIGAYFLRFVKPKNSEEHSLNRVYIHLDTNKKAYSIVLICIFISSIFFLPSLKFNTDIDSFIPRATKLRTDQQEMIRQYYSQLSIEVMVQKKGDNSSSKELNEIVLELHDKLETLPEVGKVSSVKDQIDFKSKYGAFGNFIRFPTQFNPYITQNKDAYRLDIRLFDAKDLKKVEHYIRTAFLANTDSFELKLFSNGLLIDDMNSGVAKSLFYSLFFSGIFIFLLIMIMTRSVVYSIISLFVNIVPLSVVILLFYLFQLNLNMLTAITTVVCIGLIVDDTIHILYRKLILKTELHEVSFGIITTTIILFGGFMTFAFSSFVPSQIFGVISAVVFLLTVISDLTLLPFLMEKYANRTVKKFK